MAEERSFEQWIEAFNPRFAAIYEYVKSQIPDDGGAKVNDVELSIHLEDECARLRADADSYLSHLTAQATLARIASNADLTSAERKVLVKDDVRFVQRQLDALLISESSIRSRRISILSGNKSRI